MLKQSNIALFQKLKGKSAHDLLEDKKLSKAPAVRPEELGKYEVSAKTVMRTFLSLGRARG